MHSPIFFLLLRICQCKDAIVWIFYPTFWILSSLYADFGYYRWFVYVYKKIFCLPTMKNERFLCSLFLPWTYQGWSTHQNIVHFCICEIPRYASLNINRWEAKYSRTFCCLNIFLSRVGWYVWILYLYGRESAEVSCWIPKGEEKLRCSLS